jgi:hypothetical protein
MIMEMKGYKRFEDLEDKHFGIKGTPKRDQYEFELEMEIIGAKIKQFLPC